MSFLRQVTLEEFTDGIMRCKGPARAIDTVALHADVRQLDAARCQSNEARVSPLGLANMEYK